MLEARICFLKDEIISLVRKELTRCDIKVVSRKAADVKGDMKELVGDLQRDILGSYARIHYNVDQLVLNMSNCLEKMF